MTSLGTVCITAWLIARLWACIVLNQVFPVDTGFPSSKKVHWGSISGSLVQGSDALCLLS